MSFPNYIQFPQLVLNFTVSSLKWSFFFFFPRKRSIFVLRELHISLEDQNCKNFENDSFLTARWARVLGVWGKCKSGSLELHYSSHPRGYQT